MRYHLLIHDLGGGNQFLKWDLDPNFLGCPHPLAHPLNQVLIFHAMLSAAFLVPAGDPGGELQSPELAELAAPGLADGAVDLLSRRPCSRIFLVDVGRGEF